MAGVHLSVSDDAKWTARSDAEADTNVKCWLLLTGGNEPPAISQAAGTYGSNEDSILLVYCQLQLIIHIDARVQRQDAVRP